MVRVRSGPKPASVYVELGAGLSADITAAIHSNKSLFSEKIQKN